MQIIKDNYIIAIDEAKDFMDQGRGIFLFQDLIKDSTYIVKKDSRNQVYLETLFFNDPKPTPIMEAQEFLDENYQNIHFFKTTNDALQFLALRGHQRDFQTDVRLKKLWLIATKRINNFILFWDHVDGDIRIIKDTSDKYTIRWINLWLSHWKDHSGFCKENKDKYSEWLSEMDIKIYLDERSFAKYLLQESEDPCL